MLKNLLNKLKTAIQDKNSNAPIPGFNILKYPKEVVIGILVFVIVISADLAIILKSQLKSLGVVSRQVRQIKSGIRQYKEDLANLSNLKSEDEALQAKSLALEADVFSNSDIQVFLDDKAKFYGIKLSQIIPKWEEMDKDVKELGKNGEKLYGLPIGIELESGYHELGQFLSFLENNPLIGVTNLRIQGDVFNPLRHSVTLTIKAYVRKK